jgi:hypothetical protein
MNMQGSGKLVLPKGLNPKGDGLRRWALYEGGSVRRGEGEGGVVGNVS